MVRNQLFLQKPIYRFLPLILAHKGSAFPWLVSDRATLPSILAESCAFSPSSTCNNTLACAAAPYQPFRDSTTCLSRATRSRRAHHWRSGEAYLAKPSRPNQAATACQATDWVGWIASWYHLSRVSPALHPPGPPPLNPYPKTRFQMSRGLVVHGDSQVLRYDVSRVYHPFEQGIISTTLKRLGVPASHPRCISRALSASLPRRLEFDFSLYLQLKPLPFHVPSFS